MRGLSANYVTKVSELLFRYVASVQQVSVESAKRFLGRYAEHKPNTRARYTTYIRSFLEFHGVRLDLKVKVPRSLPPFIAPEEVETLLASVAAKKTHKGTQLRDTALIETAIKTGLRRAELANLRVRDLDFTMGRLKVINGKGSKDRVIPLHPSLQGKLQALCAGKMPDARVFGLTPRSLGMKIYTWTRKAELTQLHTHSFRHYFATQLVDKGANVRAVQEILGHSSLSTTQIYLAVTNRHLEDAIGLL